MTKAVFSQMLATNNSTTDLLKKFSFKMTKQWKNHQLYQAGDACILVSDPSNERQKNFCEKHPQPSVHAIAISCTQNIIDKCKANHRTQEISFGNFTATACLDPFENIVLYLMNDSESDQFETVKKAASAVTEATTTASATADQYSLDHFAIAINKSDLQKTTEFFIDTLGFKKIYDLDIDTGSSGMRSIAVADESIQIRFPLVAPHGDSSQVQNFINKNNGPGVQHIGLHCENIIETCKHLSSQGVEFLTAPDNYYNKNPGNIFNAKQQAQLQKYNILYDVIDAQHYLLQSFCKSDNNSPFFFEVIQRHNHHTFTEKNIRSLFESVEEKCAN